MTTVIKHDATALYDKLRAAVLDEIEVYGNQIGIMSGASALAALLAETLATAPDTHRDQLKRDATKAFEAKYRQLTTH